MNSKTFTVLLALMVLVSVVSVANSCGNCYTSGRVCGHALGCSNRDGIYQCSGRGARPSYIGPCRNGCVRPSSGNHYCR